MRILLHEREYVGAAQPADTPDNVIVPSSADPRIPVHAVRASHFCPQNRKMEELRFPGHGLGESVRRHVPFT